MTSKQQQWWIPLKKHSGKTFFDISVNTGQVCMGFKANIPVNSKFAKDGHATFIFPRYLLQIPCQSDQY